MQQTCNNSVTEYHSIPRINWGSDHSIQGRFGDHFRVGDHFGGCTDLFGAKIPSTLLEGGVGGGGRVDVVVLSSFWNTHIFRDW